MDTIEILDYPAAGCGLGVTLNHVAWQILLHPGYHYSVNTAGRHSPYLEPDRGPNPWDYYFIPNEKEGETSTLSLKAIDTDLALSGHNDWSLKHQQAIGEKVRPHIRLRPEIQAQVDAFRVEYFRGRVLGIHLRGTDKIGEYRPMNNRQLIDKVAATIDRLKPDTVFLATDSSHYHNLMQRFNPCSLTIKRSDLSLHHNPPLSPYESGVTAAVDGWLLAACNYFAYTPSNFATIGLILGHHQELIRLNQWCKIHPFSQKVQELI